MGPNYLPGKKDDLYEKTIQRTVLMMGGKVGLEKTRFFILKKQALWVFVFFKNMFAQKREFLAFFQFQGYF
jgi:hypothetical protein